MYCRLGIIRMALLLLLLHACLLASHRIASQLPFISRPRLIIQHLDIPPPTTTTLLLLLLLLLRVFVSSSQYSLLFIGLSSLHTFILSVGPLRHTRGQAQTHFYPSHQSSSSLVTITIDSSHSHACFLPPARLDPRLCRLYPSSARETAKRVGIVGIAASYWNSCYC